MNRPVSPLIAARVDTTTWYTGIGIVETVELTVDGIHGGSWIDVTLGGVGTAAETAVWVLDPVGALATAGFGFAVEHVKPLSDTLDWLAGDPDQLAANERTWRNVALEHADIADLYARAARQQIPDWEGAAADRYRGQARQTVELLTALGKAAEGMAAIVAMTGSLVTLVRTLVRDLIGELVSLLLVRIPLWSLETVGTLGIASPYVTAQISALVAKWAARITRLLRALLQSLRNLIPAIRALDEAMTAIANLLSRRGIPTPARNPGPARVGAFPAWPVVNEKPGGAVAQLTPDSCVSAVGEMLSGRAQAELIEAIGSPSASGTLAEHLGPPWQGGYLADTPNALEVLNGQAPWGAELHTGNGAMHHMVLVDGLGEDGRLRIRDPWAGGSTYSMDVDKFLEYWSGNGIVKS